MKTAASLRVLRQGLHLSYSQVTTYLNCSLRYFFQYVRGLEPEHVPSSLLLGSAIHAALARYYETSLETEKASDPEAILETFRDHLCTGISQAKSPVLYKVDAPDAEALIRQGEGLLQAFLESPAFADLEVVGVELPLAARLLEEDGTPSDFDLVGAIDLLLRDDLGNLLAVDHKSARNGFTQQGVDADLQFSAYELLLRGNGFLAEGKSLACGFNVLRKLKTPKVEIYKTMRTKAHGERFAKLCPRRAGRDRGADLPALPRLDVRRLPLHRSVPAMVAATKNRLIENP